MSPPVTRPVSRVEIERSRQLIRASRVLIASAKELIRQSRGTISQQTYLKIVCAWCQKTLRWKRAEGSARGQSSHSICFDCFAPVFWELDLVNAPFHSVDLREEAHRAGGADPMAGLARHRGLLPLPADAPLTPGTFDQPI
jgi:hypothetical protein